MEITMTPKHPMGLWVLGPADSQNTRELIDRAGYAGILNEIANPAKALGYKGPLAIRAPGSRKDVPKSLSDVLNLTEADRQAFHHWTMPRVSTVSRIGAVAPATAAEAVSGAVPDALAVAKPLMAPMNVLLFYLWLSQSASPATPEMMAKVTELTRYCGAKRCFDDWPHATTEQRALLRPEDKIEPNWTNADAWAKTHPVLVSLKLWKAWADKPEFDWLLPRSDNMPMRWFLPEMPPTDERSEVVAYCRDLYLTATRNNSGTLMPVDVVRFKITAAEIMAS